jgi:hypothetical protein
LFFARHLDYFIMTRNFTAIYLDLVLSKSFTVTRDYSSVYQDWQKTRHRDADGTSLNRRAVMVNGIITCTLDRHKALTITDKAMTLDRDNTYLSTGIGLLDKFRMTRKIQHIYQDWFYIILAMNAIFEIHFFWRIVLGKLNLK